MAKKKEQSALVRYDNKLNMIALKGMTQIENDVFFALLYKLKDQGTKETQLSFTELKKLIGFEHQNNEYILKSIANIAEKIAKSVVRYETDESIKFFTLFQILEVPKQNEVYIKAKISEPFEYMINNLKDSYTAFEIAEFSSLRSKYAQTLYRFLKQFRVTGICTVFEDDWEKFIEIMDIPPKMAMRDIEKDILKPTVKELSSERTLFDQERTPFENLHYQKYKTKGQGNKITGISFYFIPESKDQQFKAQAQKSLLTIARDIKRQDALRNLKITAPKIHPITGAEIDETQQYIGRYLRIYNDKLGLIDVLKIENIKKLKDKCLEISFRNVDDNFTSSMKFKNIKHFENTFSKYGD